MKCNQTWKESQFLTVVLEPRETSGTLSTVWGIHYYYYARWRENDVTVVVTHFK
jgi:hypothetical protein